MASTLDPDLLDQFPGRIPPALHNHRFLLKADAVFKYCGSKSWNCSGKDIRHILDSTNLESEWYPTPEDDDSTASRLFYALMDFILVYALDELKNRSPPDKLIDQLEKIPLNGTSLITEVAERMLVGSLKLLISGDIPIGDDFSPAAIIEIWEESYTLRPYTREQFHECSTEIRTMLDTLFLCAEPTKYYISCRSFFELDNTCSHCISINDIVRRNRYYVHESPLMNPSELDWFHVPLTNDLILQAAMKMSNFPDISLHFKLSNITPEDRLLTYREHGYFSGKSFHKMHAVNKMIVFPTLRLTSYGQHKEARAEYKKFMDKLSSNANSGVHTARTLDEAYYPGLSAGELQARNCDQIVSGKARERSKEPFPESPILIVPQLWLWRVHSTVVSAYSFNEDVEWYLQKKEITRDHQEFSAWVPNHVGLLDPLLLMGGIMATCIENFGKESRVTYEERPYIFPPTLDIFERRVVSVLSDVQKYINNRQNIDYDTEKDIHHTIADVRSELAMIRHFLVQQQEILSSLLLEYERNKADSLKDINNEYVLRQVMEAEKKLVLYQERVRKIDGDAERIASSVQDFLNLKRTYASVQDSHASVLLSTAAIGFAFVTIIFAPLAFLTALFALDIQGFDKLRDKMDDAPPTTIAQDGSSDNQKITVNVNAASKDPAYNSAKIGGIFVGTEILTILLTAFLVWLSLRYVGIDISNLRKEHKQNRVANKNAQSTHNETPTNEKKAENGALRNAEAQKDKVGATKRTARRRGKVTDEEKQ